MKRTIKYLIWILALSALNVSALEFYLSDGGDTPPATNVTGTITVGFDGWSRTVSYDAPSVPVVDATGRYIFPSGTEISWSSVTWTNGGSAPFSRSNGWDGVTLNPRRRTGHARDDRNLYYSTNFLATSPYTLQDGDVLDFFQSVSEQQRTAIKLASKIGSGDTVLVIHSEDSVPTSSGNELLLSPCVTRGPTGRRVSDFEMIDLSALYASRPTVSFSSGTDALPPIAAFTNLIAREWTMNTLTDVDNATGGYEGFAPYHFCYQTGSTGYSGQMADIYLIGFYYLADSNTAEEDWIHIAKWIFRHGKDAIDPYLSENTVTNNGRVFYNVGNSGGGHSAHNEALAVFYAYCKGETSALTNWVREIRINWEQCIRHTARSAEAAKTAHTNMNHYPGYSHVTEITDVIGSSTNSNIAGEPAIKIKHPYTHRRTDIGNMDIISYDNGRKLGHTRGRIPGEQVSFFDVSEYDLTVPTNRFHELSVNSTNNFTVGQKVFFRAVYPIEENGYDFSILGCFIGNDGEIYLLPAMGDNGANNAGFNRYAPHESAQYKGNQNASHAVAALYIGAFAPELVAASCEINALVGCTICATRQTVQWGPWNPNETWRTPGFIWIGLSLPSTAGNLFDQAGAVFFSANNLGGTNMPHWTQPDEWFLGSLTPATFTTSATSGDSPLTVTFSDTTSGGMINRTWDFGDGTVVETTNAIVQHIYTNAGSFTISLESSAASKICIGSQTDLITVTGITAPIESESTDAFIGLDVGGTRHVNSTLITDLSLKVGADAFESNLGECCSVLVFKLPSLGSAIVESANLSLYYAADWIQGVGSLPDTQDATLPKWVDLYGIRSDGSPVVTTNDYGYKAITNATDRLIQTHLIHITQHAALPSATAETDSTGDAELADWIQEQYDNGAEAGDYIFLRVHAVFASGRPFKISPAGSSNVPVLTITLSPPSHIQSPPPARLSTSEAGVLNWTTVQGSGYTYSVWVSTNLQKGFQPLVLRQLQLT